MAIPSRLSKLEKALGSALLPPDQRPCTACKNGTERIPVVRTPRNEQEEREPAERLCPSCGRNIACLVQILRAGDGPRYVEEPDPMPRICGGEYGH